MAKRIKVVDHRGTSSKFQFTVKGELDHYFYIELKQCSGHACHHSHPEHIDPNSVPIPTRLLTLEQIGNIVHFVHATSNNGTGCNHIVGKYGKFLNLMKTAYICQREHGDLKNATDDIDEMMDNLSKSDDISFVSLADVPVKEYFEDVPVGQ